MVYVSSVFICSCSSQIAKTNDLASASGGVDVIQTDRQTGEKQNTNKHLSGWHNFQLTVYTVL